MRVFRNRHNACFHFRGPRTQHTVWAVLLVHATVLLLMIDFYPRYCNDYFILNVSILSLPKRFSCVKPELG